MNYSSKYNDGYYESLTSKIWAGVIVDNEDPLQMGRVKIRIFGKLDIRKPDESGYIPDKPLNLKDYIDESLFLTPTKDIPWFYQAGNKVFAGGESSGYGDFNFPKLGTVVQVVFVSDDIYSGQYYSIIKPNDELLSLIRDTDELANYINSHVLTLDEDERLKIFYTPSNGLELNLKDSRIILKPDNSIFIEHVDSESMIEMKGPDITIVSNNITSNTSTNKIEHNSEVVHTNGKKVLLGTRPIYKSVRYEPLLEILKVICTAIDGKFPPTPGAMVSALQAASTAIKSNSVNLS